MSMGNYDNCDICSSNDYCMASPNEPPNTNNGWLSGFKNWWFGGNNQPLSPLEAIQKTLNTLHKTQSSILSRCKTHDDSLIEGSLSPRSQAISAAKRDECYFHYNILSKCVNQVSLNVARTEYDSVPTTFSAFFGNALGQKVGSAIEPLYTEMAKNAVTATAESLQSSNS